jgi:hypothetical protein
MFHSIWNNGMTLSLCNGVPTRIGHSSMTSGNWTGGSEFTSAVDFRVASQAAFPFRLANVVHEKTSTYQFRQIPSPLPLLRHHTPLIFIYSPTLVFQYQITIPISSSIEARHSFAAIFDLSRVYHALTSRRCVPSS